MSTIITCTPGGTVVITSGSPISSDVIEAATSNTDLSLRGTGTGLVAIMNTSDNSKKIKFSPSGSTGTATIIASSQTSDRTYTLPDVADCSFVMTAGDQNINGNKYFNNNVALTYGFWTHRAITISTDADTTYSASNTTNGIIVRSGLSAGRNDSFPSPLSVAVVISFTGTNVAFFTLVNNSSFDITLSHTGWTTYYGSSTVVAGSVAFFHLYVDSDGFGDIARIS